jgi:putative ABC transport system permease protein
MLASKPQLGRFFLPEEQGTYSAKAVILSDALWRHRFGANPRLIGQSVRLNGHPITVVGVMPPNFKIIFPEGSSVPPEMDALGVHGIFRAGARTPSRAAARRRGAQRSASASRAFRRSKPGFADRVRQRRESFAVSRE